MLCNKKHRIMLNNKVLWLYNPAGQVEVMAGRKVHAGISATHLTLLPAHGTTPACVYAQSSKALLLRPSKTRKASGEQPSLLVFGRSPKPAMI